MTLGRRGDPRSQLRNPDHPRARAETAKFDWPQLPTTLAELVETAIACETAGASLIHIHIRDADHRPSLDAVLLRESVQAAGEQTSMIIQLSTGGSVHDPLEKRLKVKAASRTPAA
jgi:3-keto-5-aminohexanoate cleavage enzyme